MTDYKDDAFFFLEYGRCRSEAWSLREHKQSKVTMHKDTFVPGRQANHDNENTKHTHNEDDPQIPQPDLRFVKKTAKQKQRGKSPNNKTHKNDLPWDTVKTTVILKNVQNSYPLRQSVKHEDRSKCRCFPFYETKTSKQ